jgi:hypothetical protein
MKPGGKGERVLTDAQLDVRAFKMTSDGTQLICLRENEDSSKTQIQIINTSGDVTKIIDLSDQHFHVFGAPVLLPDKMHVGLTIVDSSTAAAGAAAPAGAANNDSSVRPRQRRRLNRSPGQGGQAVGDHALPAAIPVHPSIAVIDLDGKNLHVIGPGMLPDWSPSGKKIVYTTVDTPPEPFALWVMNSGGGNKLPAGQTSGLNIAPVFSPDGNQIAYVNVTEDSSAIYVANRDGANAVPITATKQGELAQYGSVRWLKDGKSLEATQLANSNGKISSVGTAEESISVWAVRSDGTDLKQVSPTTASALLDVDVDRMIRSVIHEGASFMRVPVMAQFTKWDPNKRIEFSGERVYTYDDHGKRIPVPDGHYVMPNGSPLIVANGTKRISGN